VAAFVTQTQDTGKQGRDGQGASGRTEKDRKTGGGRFSGFRLFWSVSFASCCVPVSALTRAAQQTHKQAREMKKRRKGREKLADKAASRENSDSEIIIFVPF